MNTFITLSFKSDICWFKIVTLCYEWITTSIMFNFHFFLFSTIKQNEIFNKRTIVEICIIHSSIFMYYNDIFKFFFHENGKKSYSLEKVLLVYRLFSLTCLVEERFLEILLPFILSFFAFKRAKTWYHKILYIYLYHKLHRLLNIKCLQK